MGAKQYARTNPFATDEEPAAPARGRSVAAASEGAGASSSIVDKVQDIIRKRGANGISGLARSFRIIDDDGSKGLSMYEFKKAMKDYGTGLTDAEIRTLFQQFDTDGSGTYSCFRLRPCLRMTHIRLNSAS
jgi:hypothetical protein